MFSHICFFFLGLLLQAVLAVPFNDAPQTSVVHQARDAAPRPTQNPQAQKLLEEYSSQTTPSAELCGHVHGEKDSPAPCAAGSTCHFNSESSVQSCGTAQGDCSTISISTSTQATPVALLAARSAPTSESSASANPTPSPTPEANPTPSKAGPIAGGAVGGVLLIAGIGGFIIWFITRKVPEGQVDAREQLGGYKFGGSGGTDSTVLSERGGSDAHVFTREGDYRGDGGVGAEGEGGVYKTSGVQRVQEM